MDMSNSYTIFARYCDNQGYTELATLESKPIALELAQKLHEAYQPHMLKVIENETEKTIYFRHESPKNTPTVGYLNTDDGESVLKNYDEHILQD